MAKRPPINHTTMLEHLAEDLAAIIEAEGEAREKAKTAKEDATSIGTDSIRKFSARFAQVNITLDDKDVDKLTTDIVKLANITVPSRKSELKTLLGQGRQLAAIIVDLDKRKAKDPKAVFNIREKTIAAARKLRDANNDNAPITVAEAVSKVIKAPLTEEQKVRALIQRLRESQTYEVKVGDERMTDEGAERLLAALENLIDGVRPPAFAVEDIEDEVAEMVADAIVDVASNNWGSVVEALGGAQDGDELGGVPDTPEISEAPPEAPDATLAGAKAKAVHVSSTGLGFDDLMDLVSGKKKS